MNPFPDTKKLASHLSSLFPEGDAPIRILARTDFRERSTFPVEIVTCRTAAGNDVMLFCKYLGGMGPNNYGHRGGVEYEAKVYEQLLKNIPSRTIKYYGRFRIEENDETVIVIEYLGAALRMLYAGDPTALVKASDWIGTFHRLFEGKAPEFVKRYDRTYYAIWSERFRTITAPDHKKYPWYLSLSSYYDDNIDVMLDCPQTIIHGEYYPKNVLMKDGIIYPTDWESAAVGPGEIDLASLIEGWGPDVAAGVVQTYKAARWPDGKTSVREFEQRLLLAQIYFHFWWWHESEDDSQIHESESFQNLFRLAQKAGVA